MKLNNNLCINLVSDFQIHLPAVWRLRTQESPLAELKPSFSPKNGPNEAPSTPRRLHPEINSFERNTQTTRTEIKAPYLPWNCSGRARRKFQQDLIVFSCGPDGAALGRGGERWWGLQTRQEVALTRDTWHSKLTSSAYYLSKKKFWRVQKGDPFRQELMHCSAHRAIPGMTSKKTLCQSFAEWPLSCIAPIYHPTMLTGDNLSVAPSHQSQKKLNDML